MRLLSAFVFVVIVTANPQFNPVDVLKPIIPPGGINEQLASIFGTLQPYLGNAVNLAALGDAGNLLRIAIRDFSNAADRLASPESFDPYSGLSSIAGGLSQISLLASLVLPNEIGKIVADQIDSVLNEIFSNPSETSLTKPILVVLQVIATGPSSNEGVDIDVTDENLVAPNDANMQRYINDFISCFPDWLDNLDKVAKPGVELNDIRQRMLSYLRSAKSTVFDLLHYNDNSVGMLKELQDTAYFFGLHNQDNIPEMKSICAPSLVSLISLAAGNTDNIPGVRKTEQPLAQLIAGLENDLA